MFAGRTETTEGTLVVGQIIFVLELDFLEMENRVRFVKTAKLEL